ncbi:MAG: Flp pilus assembly complex ATPase component TadA, partial [Candidatus Obscuribacterales bacterium]|nr:Flp pilus assembly complex ATPase component TadA [Candidatus Obscuribacterales bacterium]
MSLAAQISIEDILELAIEYKASDIHLKANMPPVFRIDGLIRSVPDLPVLDPESLRHMIFGFLTPRQQQVFEENFELDCALLFGDAARVRVNVYLDIDSVGCAMRIVPIEVPTVEELGLPLVIDKLTKERQGLILVCGVTGAGKSTTFKMLCGLLKPTEGESHVSGFNLRVSAALAREKIGYMAQKFSLFNDLTVRQN